MEELHSDVVRVIAWYVLGESKPNNMRDLLSHFAFEVIFAFLGMCVVNAFFVEIEERTTIMRRQRICIIQINKCPQNMKSRDSLNQSYIYRGGMPMCASHTGNPDLRLKSAIQCHASGKNPFEPHFPETFIIFQRRISRDAFRIELLPNKLCLQFVNTLFINIFSG